MVVCKCTINSPDLYRIFNGICWFCMIIFIKSGGGLVLQCQYKQTENKIYILDDFEPLNNINNKLCIQSKIYNNLLYCCLIDNITNENNYDIYFCDIKHYLTKNNNINIIESNFSSTKWIFKRMYRRQEYINRILYSIKNEFNFDIFYNY